MQHYVRPDGTPPTNGYSHAVAFTGPTIMLSGQVPLNEAGELVGEGDTLEQARQVFRNMTTVLAAAGATMSDVVKLTVFLTDAADLPAFRQARVEALAPDQPPPASSLVRVAGLAHPAWRIEVEAVAVLPGPTS